MAGLRQHGYPEAILWVLDTNGRAQCFYEKGGLVKDGAERWDDRAGCSFTSWATEPRSEPREDRTGPGGSAALLR